MGDTGKKDKNKKLEQKVHKQQSEEAQRKQQQQQKKLP